MKSRFLELSGSRPIDFHGAITLPPSKSYLHRALFVSALCSGPSRIKNCGSIFSDDVQASIETLESFGVKIKKFRKGSNTELKVYPKPLSTPKKQIFAHESGTTARFAIAFASTIKDGKGTVISGDSSLLKRPMKPLLDALSQIGVVCHSKNSGRLPVVVQSKGIKGGKCNLQPSISSQFVSALLIASTKSVEKVTIEIMNSRKMVSMPYIRATLTVLRHFGFSINERRLESSLLFDIEPSQVRRGGTFVVPGDMSSGSALIGAAISSKGRVHLRGVNLEVPQADSLFLSIVEEFGARVYRTNHSIVVHSQDEHSEKILDFDLKDAPDIVPIIAGLAAATRKNVTIRNVGHLRYKESDRLSAISKELGKIGVKVIEREKALTIKPKKIERQNRGMMTTTVLNSYNDHRILMALTVAGISGRFGKMLISNPSCVDKSYPSFIADLRKLTSEPIVSIVEKKI